MARNPDDYALSITITQSDRTALDAESARLGVARSAVVRAALRKSLGKLRPGDVADAVPRQGTGRVARKKNSEKTSPPA